MHGSGIKNLMINLLDLKKSLLKIGIIMSKKVGRPKSKNVPYFPHYTEATTELTFLENCYGAEGYRAYYRLLELLTKTNDHFIKLQNKIQILTFRFSMKVEKDTLDKVIDYLVEMEFIDNDMYHNENIIWIPDLVDCFKLVYYKRGRGMPQKVGSKIVSDTRNTQYSNKVSKKSNKPTIVDNTKTTTDVGKVIDDFKNKHKEVDVDKSIAKLKKKNPNPNAEDVGKWLANGLANHWDIKIPDVKKTPSGMLKAKCLKCGDTDSLQDMRGFQTTHHCGGEYEPIYEETDAKIA
jgi:hypothetical protein